MRVAQLQALLGEDIEVRRVALVAGQWHVTMRGPASVEDLRHADLGTALLEGIRLCRRAHKLTQEAAAQ